MRSGLPRGGLFLSPWADSSAWLGATVEATSPSQRTRSQATGGYRPTRPHSPCRGPPLTAKVDGMLVCLSGPA